MMKKKVLLLLTMLLVGGGIMEADEFYLVGGNTDSGWETGEKNRSAVRAYPKGTTWACALKLTTGDANANIRFKILGGTGWDNAYFAPTQNTELTAEWSSLSEDATGDNKFIVATEGNYLVTFKTDTKEIKAEKLTEPSLVDGYYQIGSVTNYYWFAAHINQAGNSGAKAKLTADLDFDGKVFIPLACEKYHFCGEFDGQGHSIKNATLSCAYSKIGLFSYATSGASIHDIVLTNTCSFSGVNRVAGFVGGIEKKAGSVDGVSLLRLGFEGNIYGSGSNNGGILGVNAYVKDNGGYTPLTMTDCYTIGTISSGAGESGQLTGWAGDGTAHVTNCFSIGAPGSGCEKFGRVTDADVVNCYTDQDGVTKAAKVESPQISDGTLVRNLGDAFRQGTEHPVFNGTTVTSGDATNYYYNSKASMTLTDMADYAASGNFTATSLTYDRTLAAGGYHSLCLPFAVTTEMLGEGSKLFTLSAVGTDAVTLTETPSVAAGTPCFASVTSDFTFGTMTDVAMVKDVDNNGTIKGTFTNNADLGAGFYKLDPTGTYFGLTTDGATATAFRSYILAGSVSVKTLNILLSDGTSLTPTLSEEREAVIYDLAGRRVTKATKGLYIINGKKVVK